MVQYGTGKYFRISMNFLLVPCLVYADVGTLLGLNSHELRVSFHEEICELLTGLEDFAGRVLKIQSEDFPRHC